MSNANTGGSEELTVSKALDVRQEAALEILVSGKSVAETARTTGVNRTTIFRWLRDDLAFRAAYNRWKEELKESCRGRLLSLTDKATGALEGALEKGDAKMAFALLKQLGLIEAQKPEVTEAAELGERAKLLEKKKKAALEKALRKVDLDDQYSRLAHVEFEKTVKEWGKDEPGVMKNSSVKWKE